MKKFISVLVLVCIFTCLFTVNAFAIEKTVGTIDELNSAISSANDGDTIKLTASITASDKIVINKAITLDGAGNKLTVNSGDRAIEVECSATIKNLTVECTGARGINCNVAGTSLTLNAVNVTATTYAVSLPSDSDNVNVSISSSTLTSHVPVNMWGANSNVTVSDSALYSKDDNLSDNTDYSAIHVNEYATGATVTVTGSDLNVESPNQPAIWVSTKGATVNASGHSVGVAQIKHGSGGTSATLEDAIEDYTSGETLYLLRDIDLGGKIIEVDKDITIDMDGSKITNGALKVAEGKTVTVEGWTGTQAELNQLLSGKLPVPVYVPATADNSQMGLWCVLFAALAVTAMLTRKKRTA